MKKEKKEDKSNLKIESKDIDLGALFIIKRLNDSDYEAFVVGGCIRNLIMGEEVRDWDITTRAASGEIVEVFIYRENFREGEDLLEHTLDMAASLSPDLNLRLSVLLYNIKSISRFDEKKEIMVKILQRIKFKNAVIRKVAMITQENWQALNFSKKINIRKLASRVGMENLEDAWELKKALIKESRSPEKSKSVEIERGENNIKEILQERPPVSLKDLAVNGKDLIELGYNDGKEIGQILKELLNLVLEKPALNQKKILLNRAQEKKFPPTIKQV